MNPVENKAVFLSYASQDAEAAKRICDALRAAGVEVWFDQSELVGGDAWDAKIRRQIKECALFVPIISASTQARTEGYFRLEWRLADQRTHLMAKGRPFLVPVVIDATRDAAAHVPDSFTEVQWTRLPGGETPATFGERVKKLLGAESGTGILPVWGTLDHGQDVGATPIRRTRLPLWLVPAALLGVLALAIWQWPRNAAAELETKTPNAIAAPTVPVPQPAEWTPRDPELAKAWRLIMDLNFNWDDTAVADDIVKHALQQNPGDVEAAIVQTWTLGLSLSRGWDPKGERLAGATQAGERAFRLAPDNPWALAGLGGALMRGPDRERAEKLVRRAIELNSNIPRLHSMLANVVSFTNPAEATRIQEEAARRFPSDPLMHYYLYLRTNGTEKGRAALDRTLELAPMASAMLYRAHDAFLEGDLATVKRMLDQLPDTWRSADRAVFWRWLYARYAGEPESALAFLRTFPRAEVRDQYYTGPKTALIGDLLFVAGRTAEAKPYLESTLAAGRAARAELSNVRWNRWAEMFVLLALGRKEEARAIADAFPADHGINGMSWLSAIQANLLLDRRDRALEGARKAAAKPGGRQLYRFIFAKDPLLGPWRDDPEFKAILAEPAQPVAPAAMPNLKSVAVLAFRQLSADPENEYLCEAISDELCGVLGRVPGLKVAASASAFSLKGKRVRPSEMAAQLGVAYLVDGTVQKIGSRVRVRAELIKASDESVVWKSDTLDHEVKDMFAVQDQVVSAIAQNLQLQLGGGKLAPVTIDPEAYRLYYEGRRMWSMRGAQEPVDRARALFEQALQKDANLGRAYAGLADTVGGEDLGYFGPRSSPEAAELQRLTEKAITLEPLSAETHTSHGRMLWNAWRPPEAERAFRHALELNPNHAEAHLYLGQMLHTDGRTDEALVEIRKAMELDPLTSRIFDNWASVLIDLGRHEEALRPAERALVLQPESRQAQRAKLLALSGLGRHDDALAIARESAHATHFVAGVALARAGRQDEARKWLKNYRGHVVGRTIVLLALGERDEALDSIPIDLVTMTAISRWFYWPELDPVRNDPRFVRVLEQVGMKAAHDRAQVWRAANLPPKADTQK